MILHFAFALRTQKIISRLLFDLFGFSQLSVLFLSFFYPLCIKNQRRDGYLSFLFPFNPALYVMKTGEPRG
ncbi:hypothetical protein BJY01DRAFT_166883 [Aspergillus pseudoustus]|uniref:Uncharacterized protein n=1 Tax=Aspergillus pseudoustus TaxID=1810923 RepID=A0ABR4K4J4_9EURO